MAKTEDLSFENMKRAVIYGSAMASFCVEEFSIEQLLRLDDEKINARIQQFTQLVHFEL